MFKDENDNSSVDSQEREAMGDVFYKLWVGTYQAASQILGVDGNHPDQNQVQENASDVSSDKRFTKEVNCSVAGAVKVFGPSSAKDSSAVSEHEKVSAEEKKDGFKDVDSAGVLAIPIVAAENVTHFSALGNEDASAYRGSNEIVETSNHNDSEVPPEHSNESSHPQQNTNSSCTDSCFCLCFCTDIILRSLVIHNRNGYYGNHGSNQAGVLGQNQNPAIYGGTSCCCFSDISFFNDILGCPSQTASVLCGGIASSCNSFLSCIRRASGQVAEQAQQSAETIAGTGGDLVNNGVDAVVGAGSDLVNEGVNALGGVREAVGVGADLADEASSCMENCVPFAQGVIGCAGAVVSCLGSLG